MITEDCVSFETAKLLKEKGFDEGCSFVVNTISKGVMPVSWPTTNSEIEDEKASLIALPTLQMAMKWLREVHNLHIVVFHYDNSAFPYIWYIFAHNGYKPNKANSYEQACEAAIKYCLEHLI